MTSKKVRPIHQMPLPTLDEPDEPEPPPEPIVEPTENFYDVYIHCFENPLYNNKNAIGVDLPARYPDTSFGGHR